MIRWRSSRSRKTQSDPNPKPSSLLVPLFLSRSGLSRKTDASSRRGGRTTANPSLQAPVTCRMESQRILVTSMGDDGAVLVEVEGRQAPVGEPILTEEEKHVEGKGLQEEEEEEEGGEEEEDDDDDGEYVFQFGSGMDPLDFIKDDDSGLQPYQQFEGFKYEALAKKKQKGLDSSQIERCAKKACVEDNARATFEEIMEAMNYGSRKSRSCKSNCTLE